MVGLRRRLGVAGHGRRLASPRAPGLGRPRAPAVASPGRPSQGTRRGQPQGARRGRRRRITASCAAGVEKLQTEKSREEESRRVRNEESEETDKIGEGQYGHKKMYIITNCSIIARRQRLESYNNKVDVRIVKIAKPHCLLCHNSNSLSGLSSRSRI